MPRGLGSTKLQNFLGRFLHHTGVTFRSTNLSVNFVASSVTEAASVAAVLAKSFDVQRFKLVSFHWIEKSYSN